MDNAMREKLHFIIENYKENFEQINKEERYKWEAIAWYQRHWDIEAKNFAEMLENAFGKTFNLLSAGMYFPRKVLIEYAQEHPEDVRAIFRHLHDETISLEERFLNFRQSFDLRIAELEKKTSKKIQSYQDLRAVMLYLTFQYPEKYFLFKSTMYTAFRDRIGYLEDNTITKSKVSQYEQFHKLCELILEEIKSDDELIMMSKNRLDDNCYQDEAMHLLVMDIIYYGSNYVSKDTLEYGSYWPSLDEYNPNISKDKWIDLLNNDTIANEKTITMLYQILKLGGESTCANLAEIFGGSAFAYNSWGRTFGERVHKETGCELCKDGNKERFYTVPFVGRNIMERGHDRYSWKLRAELKEALESDMMNEANKILQKQVQESVYVALLEDEDCHEKNIILYGPPGTGKTYHTATYALSICDGIPLNKLTDRDMILNRYNELINEGRISFTTFHQSYGYEEFIEGIKPQVYSDDETNGIQYNIEPGIFKQFCTKANNSTNNNLSDWGINNSPTIWKVSLESTGDNKTRTECMNNNHIRIGYDYCGKDITDETDFSVAGGRNVLNAFINKMQIGDIVLSCYTASTIDAIGVITGDYEWHDEYPNYKRLRKVNWIVKGINENIVEINKGTTMTLSSVYEMKINISDIYKIIEKYKPVQHTVTNIKKENYVFIIDEINRGNISKIFGELITLIEDSKRAGMKDAISAILPYSGELFSIPSNVYIIGTMNTADRSIALMDTALRRRFHFVEMMPNPELLKDVEIEGIDIAQMLDVMNKRIEYLYDREHTIGHAFFMKLKDNPTMETLQNIFEKSIIPLLQEYFYEDYQKIQLVLGDNGKENEAYKFILNTSVKVNDIFMKSVKNNASVENVVDILEYQYSINKEAFSNPESYKGIYE